MEESNKKYFHKKKIKMSALTINAISVTLRDRSETDQNMGSQESNSNFFQKFKIL